MKVIDDHHYQLQEARSMDSAVISHNNVMFMRKERDSVTHEFELIHTGTTNEEVLDMLIHRLGSMQQKLPCNENLIVMQMLLAANWTLKLRTKRRLQQGVEGTDKQHHGVSPESENLENEIKFSKTLRSILAPIVELIVKNANSAERTLAMRAAQQCRHWLGEDLAKRGEPSPYPAGNDPTTTKVDPPADVPTGMLPSSP